MKLGDFIYSYRQKNKLSMDDFSKKSGISKTYSGIYSRK
jgi:transcriptional regulator with XRE-family HTH domain